MELVEMMEEVLKIQEEQKLIERELQNYFEEIKYIEKLVIETEYIQQSELESYELWKECY
ncbi:hypothetical protein PMY12_14610 [Clostridium tertium]|uniref:hypothetical protein n=1 Tax=Clostridium TaxID=1485 RepID=UPI001D8001EC|nr:MULTISPECIES: hypothetical protein [Clostridium]MBS5936799.1 hypothetical protein [Clostridium sp.]MDB1931718.1 hypothetical protein [Clostridium tertium]MDB1938236.1 hypothetical protein [Clostridium tertium]MDU1278350.1 hypothetical protein [Clostridium sp.]MDU7089168.1 hypothetical protein [Clostridium sp.]